MNEIRARSRPGRIPFTTDAGSQAWLSRANQVKTVCNTYQNEASKAVKDAGSALDKARISTTAVFSARNQLHRVRRILGEAIAQTRHLSTLIGTSAENASQNANAYADGYESVPKQIDTIFNVLKSKEIDERLGHPESTTLYDFVDEESVEKISKAIMTHCKRLRQQAHVADNVKGKSAECLEKLLNSFGMEEAHGNGEKRDTVSLDMLLSSVGDKADAAVMAADKKFSIARTTLVEVRKLCDNVVMICTAIISAATDMKPPTEKVEITFLNIMDMTIPKKIPHLLTHLQETCKKVIEECTVSRRAAGRASMLHQGLVRVHGVAEEVQLELQTNQLEISGVEREISTEIRSSQALSDELRSLIYWYSGYVQAYDSLVPEIKRRLSELARQQSFVDATQRNLARMHRDETELRNRFYMTQGQYLPTSLCPGLTEPLRLRHVVPPTFSITLPRGFFSADMLDRVEKSQVIEDIGEENS